MCYLFSSICVYNVPLTTQIFSFSFSLSGHHPDPHSSLQPFPTRRSSDPTGRELGSAARSPTQRPNTTGLTPTLQRTVGSHRPPGEAKSRPPALLSRCRRGIQAQHCSEAQGAGTAGPHPTQAMGRGPWCSATAIQDGGWATRISGIGT